MAKEYRKPSRSDQLRALEVGECHSESKVLPDTKTARDAKEVTNSMRLAICSTLSGITKNSNKEFERSTQITFNKRGNMIATMIVERTK